MSDSDLTELFKQLNVGFLELSDKDLEIITEALEKDEEPNDELIKLAEEYLEKLKNIKDND